ncbi:hypothetical protein [Gloeocapsopsis dulcis]|uniref:hypothetical protein n=1 Tax=Gloeocapsopsis dulcis TaxID=2859516 RepID=UPI0018C7F074|nr:hypothetical protein [Gloeocapsopsis dulcis]WNN89526.1 hypothetical protein P0S91_25390 [Gloeocapsopsis dulcis]
MLEAIATIARYTQNPKDRAALSCHAEMIQRDRCEGVSEELDKKDIEKRYQAVLKAPEIASGDRFVNRHPSI